MRLLDASGQSYDLDPVPLASGGEGAIHRVLSSPKGHHHARHLVAKVFDTTRLSPTKIADRRPRLDHLIAHPPPALAVPAGSGQHTVAAWPRTTLFQSAGHSLAGFTLDLVNGARTLDDLFPLSGNFSAPFDRLAPTAPHGPAHRLVVARNVAAAVAAVHAAGTFVLHDLKPPNVMVKPSGLVTLVDIESVQITDAAGTLLFDATAFTDEYLPPEYLTDAGQPNLPAGPASVGMDLHALGVLLYQFLFGLRPFAGRATDPRTGTPVPPSQDLVKARLGLVAFGRPRQHFTIVPPPHATFGQAPAPLQDLFVRCLIDGHADPTRRPPAREWAQVLEGLRKSAVGLPQPWQPPAAARQHVLNRQARAHQRAGTTAAPAWQGANPARVGGRRQGPPPPPAPGPAVTPPPPASPPLAAAIPGVRQPLPIFGISPPPPPTGWTQILSASPRVSLPFDVWTYSLPMFVQVAHGWEEVGRLVWLYWLNRTSVETKLDGVGPVPLSSSWEHFFGSPTTLRLLGREAGRSMPLIAEIRIDIPQHQLAAAGRLSGAQPLRTQRPNAILRAGPLSHGGALHQAGLLSAAGIRLATALRLREFSAKLSAPRREEVVASEALNQAMPISPRSKH